MHTSPMLWKLLLKERKCHNSKVFTLMKNYDCSGCLQYIQIKDGLRFFPFKKNTQEITSHPTLPPHLFVSKSYKPTKCQELNAKVGNLSLTYVPAFFFPTKSWDKAAVSALAWNFLAPVSTRWLQFSPFLLPLSLFSSEWFTLLPHKPIFQESQPSFQILGCALLKTACSKETPSAPKCDTGQPHHTLPRQNNSFPLGSPQHKLSKHYLRFQVLPYLWLKFSLFRREKETE